MTQIVTTTYSPLPSSVLTQIQTMNATAQASPQSTPGLYAPAYQLIYDSVKNNPSVDQGTKNWLEVAVKVNSGDPKSLVFQYIRTETQTALAEHGKIITDQRFTEGSNKLGSLVVANILARGALPSARGADGLVMNDAMAVVSDFGGSLTDWAGVTPYSGSCQGSCRLSRVDSGGFRGGV